MTLEPVLTFPESGINRLAPDLFFPDEPASPFDDAGVLGGFTAFDTTRLAAAG